MADAHNLAYKIALVHRGVAHPSLLSTYTAERRSVADVYSKQSVKNGRQIFALLRSLNIDGVDDPAEARRNMMAALADPSQRARVDEGIQGQTEHFDNVSFPFPSKYRFFSEIDDTNTLYSLRFTSVMYTARANPLPMPPTTAPDSYLELACLMRGFHFPMPGPRRVVQDLHPCLVWSQSMSRM